VCPDVSGSMRKELTEHNVFPIVARFSHSVRAAPIVSFRFPSLLSKISVRHVGRPSLPIEKIELYQKPKPPVEKDPFTPCWGWSATNPSRVSLTSLITIQTQTTVAWGRAP
jgi:hypothetical protein